MCGWILARMSLKDAQVDSLREASTKSSRDSSQGRHRIADVTSVGITAGDNEEPLLELASVLRKHSILDQVCFDHELVLHQAAMRILRGMLTGWCTRVARGIARGAASLPWQR